MLLTYGDSLHSLISDAAVAEVLHVVVDQTRSRALGDLPATARIIRDFDHPWMTFADTPSGAFDAMDHGAQEIFDIAGRWRRPRYHSLDDAKMERLRALCAGSPNLDAAAGRQGGQRISR